MELKEGLRLGLLWFVGCFVGLGSYSVEIWIILCVFLCIFLWNGAIGNIFHGLDMLFTFF